jgi:hypothetical protein
VTVDEAPRTPTLAELLAIHGDSIKRSSFSALPGRIEKYDAATQKASVKPLVKDRVPTKDGSELLEPFPIIQSVPVVWPRAGGFFLTMPLAVGDLVLLVFADRSIDKFKSSRGTDTDPDDFRMHDIADAVALPGCYPFGMGVGDSGVGTHLVLGEEGGAQVHVKSDEIALYSENPAAFVARADRSDTDDQAITTDIEALRTAIAGWVPVPNDGGLALKTALAGWLATTISLAGSACDKVKAT